MFLEAADSAEYNRTVINISGLNYGVNFSGPLTRTEKYL
jgi:hypothetical protein